MSTLTTVKPDQIKESPVRLRNVDRENDDYLGIVESMRKRGFLGAITVRPTDEEGVYELIDGLHRYSAAIDAGIEEIPVSIVSLDETGVLEAQIMANVHKVETKPVEYSNQLKRLMSLQPMLTLDELADSLGKSTAWLRQRLQLTRITNERIAELVDEGRIKLSNAYTLTKLPDEEMESFLEQAITMDAEEFTPLVAQRLKDIREAKRKGGEAPATEWQPVAKPRKRGELVDEYDKSEACRALCAQQGLGDEGIKGFKLAIEWSLNLDPVSVEAQRAAHEEREAHKAEAKRKRDAEKAEKKAKEQEEKAKEAAEAAAAARAELE